ncbi:MAG: hypothetical protein M1834_005570 [Cirrosporium novae-zelandiae]|nr:MAG: hypothetical protein M1834_005570 [Cirrosporium novae-zelandiae]
MYHGNSAEEVASEKEDETLLEMANRIERMESLLAASGLDVPASSSNTDDTSPTEQEKLSDRLTTLIIGDEPGTSHFWGPSSGFSIFSPQGLQWIAEKTGTDELQGFIAELANSQSTVVSTGFAQLCNPIFARRASLPPRFFGSINTAIPLFDQASFLQLYEKQYSSDPPRGAAWYASLNIVFAIGSMALALGEQGSTPEPVAQDQIEPWSFWEYCRNAYSVFTELLFTSHNMLAVQALLGMAFLLESILDAQSAYIVVAAATRIAYGIGLHRKMTNPQDYDLSPMENRQRRNVFWILYVVEKTLTLRLGRPAVINDDDIDVPLPELGDLWDRTSNPEDNLNIFYHQVMLSRIESKIYTELYSVRSQRRAMGDRLRSIALLDKELQEWQEELPLMIRPGQPITCPPNQIAQVVILHFAYYNCITTVHRAPAHCALWTMNSNAGKNIVQSDSRVHHRVYASHLHCINAARSTAQLLSYFDQPDGPSRSVLVHLGLYCPFSAFITLFAHIIQNPQDSHVESDNELMDAIARLFLPLPNEANDSIKALARKVFEKLRSIIVRFLSKVSSQNKASKRDYENSSTLMSIHQPVSPDINSSMSSALSPNILDMASAEPRQTFSAASNPLIEPDSYNDNYPEPLIPQGQTASSYDTFSPDITFDFPPNQPNNILGNLAIPSYPYMPFNSNNFQYDLIDYWNIEPDINFQGRWDQGSGQT